MKVLFYSCDNNRDTEMSSGDILFRTLMTLSIWIPLCFNWKNLLWNHNQEEKKKERKLNGWSRTGSFYTI